jgi:NADH:ubiquinone oxidoreductase subunit D
MPTYANLTAADRAIVDNATNTIRSACGEMARIFNHVKAIADDTNATGLVTSLDAGQVVPQTSGLAGAATLTREEVIALYNLLAGIRTTNDTPANRAAMSKAAGVNAMLG